MVIASSAAAELSRPHIGSDVRGGAFFGASPESQCPALPAQQGIDSSSDALAIGTRIAKNDKATRKHKMLLKTLLCFLCFFAVIRGDILVHRAAIVKLSRRLLRNKVAVPSLNRTRQDFDRIERA